MPHALHLQLDDAWPDGVAGLATCNARAWGPRLRFSAPVREVEGFFFECEPQLAPFILYGSGDFHHLTALWLRKIKEPVVVISFDNHPDWDVRPPRWACGGWVNRALALTHVRRVSVWGCGGFECWWPGQIFGNRAAERAGKLSVHAWADARPERRQSRAGAIVRDNWRRSFEQELARHHSAAVYVTIDLDCLVSSEAVTNWESGWFTAEDVAWALERLRESTRIIGGDICGAYSVPKYARWKQEFAANWDHPKIGTVDITRAREINQATLRKLWPVLANER